MSGTHQGQPDLGLAQPTHGPQQQLRTGVVHATQAAQVDAQGAGLHADLDELGKLPCGLTIEDAGKIDGLDLGFGALGPVRGKVEPGRGGALELGGVAEAKRLEALPLTDQAQQIEEHAPQGQPGVGTPGGV